jgi:hypothetical protein
LLCLSDIDDLKVYFNNLKNILVTPSGKIPIIRCYGHLFLVKLLDYTASYLTETELRQLHRHFGHPLIGRLINILTRISHNTDCKILKHLTKYCTFCQKYGKSPKRFRFTIKDNDKIVFNYTIVVDIFIINSKLILHVVDVDTRFQAAKWLDNISAKCIWDTLRKC